VGSTGPEGAQTPWAWDLWREPCPGRWDLFERRNLTSRAPVVVIRGERAPHFLGRARPPRRWATCCRNGGGGGGRDGCERLAPCVPWPPGRRGGGPAPKCWRLQDSVTGRGALPKAGDRRRSTAYCIRRRAWISSPRGRQSGWHRPTPIFSVREAKVRDSRGRPWAACSGCRRSFSAGQPGRAGVHRQGHLGRAPPRRSGPGHRTWPPTPRACARRPVPLAAEIAANSPIGRPGATKGGPGGQTKGGPWPRASTYRWRRGTPACSPVRRTSVEAMTAFMEKRTPQSSPGR